MRVCPQCNTRYSDDTLRYCLQDGTPLSAPDEHGEPTLVVSRPEVETDPRGKRIDLAAGDPSAGYRDGLDDRGPGGSRLPLVIAAAVLGTLMVAGLGAFAAWLYFSSRNGGQTNVNIAVNNRNTPANNANTRPSPSPSPTKTATPTPDPADKARDEEIRREVSGIVTDWMLETEDLDIDSYMEHYAPRVDYYNKTGANSAEVRADKERAFLRYDTIRLDISNVDVTIDPSGETATAVFDKEWNFSGDGTSAGKVQQLLRFRNFRGKWLITAEKDLKVYYTR